MPFQDKDPNPDGPYPVQDRPQPKFRGALGPLAWKPPKDSYAPGKAYWWKHGEDAVMQPAKPVIRWLPPSQRPKPKPKSTRGSVFLANRAQAIDKAEDNWAHLQAAVKQAAAEAKASSVAETGADLGTELETEAVHLAAEVDAEEA